MRWNRGVLRVRLKHRRIRHSVADFHALRFRLRRRRRDETAAFLAANKRQVSLIQTRTVIGVDEVNPGEFVLDQHRPRVQLWRRVIFLDFHHRGRSGFANHRSRLFYFIALEREKVNKTIRVLICARVNESSSSSSSNSFSERAATATATAAATAAAARERERERGGEEMMRDLLETNFFPSADKTIKQERRQKTTTTNHDVRNGRIRTRLAAAIRGERIQRRPGASS